MMRLLAFYLCASLIVAGTLLAGCDSASGQQDCHTINAHQINTTNPQHPGDDEHCLVQAFARCSPAKLVFEQYGVDAGATYTITVSGASKTACALVVREDDQSNTLHSTQTYSCRQLQQQVDTLTVSQCAGHDDIIITGPSGASS